jgi:hypothetical protein
MADCGPPPVSSVFSKHLGEENIEEWIEEEEWVEGEDVIEYSEEEVEEEDVEDDIRKEQEKTSSLISEVTKWEKMCQALSEGALTKDMIDSYKR